MNIRKILSSIFITSALALAGCVAAYPVVAPTEYGYYGYVVDPVCCVWYNGVYGFWYNGFFYDHVYWRHGFRGGVPHRFMAPNFRQRVFR